MAVQGLQGTALFLAATAVAAATVGASYLDSRLIYPSIFGSNNPRSETVGGIDVMTGEDGAPGHRAWGRTAIVGGHVLWFENLEVSQTSQGSKKGAGATLDLKRADFGVGLCRNLIQSVDLIFADQKTFWRRSWNSVLWQDFRATITAVGTVVPGDTLRIVPDSGDTQAIAPPFTVGDVVLLSDCTPIGILGYWRVLGAYQPGQNGLTLGGIDLSPLQGQTPAAGVAGTSIVPMRMLRADTAFIDSKATWKVQNGDLIVIYYDQETLPSALSDSHWNVRPRNTLPPGIRVRISGFTPSTVDGLWDVVGHHNVPVGPGREIHMRPAELQALPPLTTSPVTIGTATSPVRVIPDYDVEGFLEPVAQQELSVYPGRLDEGADPDLSAVYGSSNAHGYQGLARFTIRKGNLSNWGDRVPQLSAACRVNERHTTHDVIRDIVAESFGGDHSRYDLTDLPPNDLLGYAQRGMQPGSTTLQPIAVAYAIESQERGSTWAFFKPETADLHQLRESEIGIYVGAETTPPERFMHRRIQDRDLPRRLRFYYRNPNDDYTRGDRLVRTGSPDDPQQEEVAINVEPLVMWPWDAQDAVERLYMASIVGRDQGTITVPPSRMNILPNDRVTFTALNWNEETLALDAGAIDHATRIKPIEPRSISIEVEFSIAGRCRLVDDGDGEIQGFPASVTPSANAVDYDAGTIEFDSDDPIVQGVIRYEFPNAWRMRVQRIKRQVNNVTELELVAVSETFRVIGSPVTPNRPSYAIASRPAILVPHVLDIAMPWFFVSPGLMFAACARRGSDWRGAGVYSSTDGTSYVLRALVTEQTTIGIAETVLGNGVREVVDWVNTVTVAMEYGTLEDASIDDVQDFSARNWILLGDEILIFLRASLQSDGTYILSGLIRGLRDTADAMATHVAGERAVLLSGLGSNAGNGGTFADFDLPGDIGQTLWFKFVPSGAMLDDYEAVQATVTAQNVRPYAPDGIVQGDIATHGYEWDILDSTYDPAAWLVEDLTIRWFRRSRVPVQEFATAPLVEPIEKYEVQVYRNGIVLPHRTRQVGGVNSGSPYAHRLFRYTLAEQTADGWVSTDVATFVVRQVGIAGSWGYSRPAVITWTIP